VVNALDMAIRNRRPEPGGIVHADHGTQFTSWILRGRDPLRRPSAVVGHCWRRPGQRDDGVVLVLDADRAARPQAVEDRIELANAIFEFIEIFYNRQRRHSALGYRTPIEYELLSENDIIPAAG
jgi:putative transposase